MADAIQAEKDKETRSSTSAKPDKTMIDMLWEETQSQGTSTAVLQGQGDLDKWYDLQMRYAIGPEVRQAVQHQYEKMKQGLIDGTMTSDNINHVYMQAYAIARSHAESQMANNHIYSHSVQDTNSIGQQTIDQLDYGFYFGLATDYELPGIGTIPYFKVGLPNPSGFTRYPIGMEQVTNYGLRYADEVPPSIYKKITPFDFEGFLGRYLGENLGKSLVLGAGLGLEIIPTVIEDIKNGVPIEYIYADIKLGTGKFIFTETLSLVAATAVAFLLAPLLSGGILAIGAVSLLVLLTKLTLDIATGVIFDSLVENTAIRDVLADMESVTNYNSEAGTMPIEIPTPEDNISEQSTSTPTPSSSD